MSIVKLKNGLKFIIYDNKCLKGSSITAFIKCGSRNENRKNIYGISHLIEHMLFKGTHKRPSAQLLNNDIYSKGGNTNAFTGVELTGFYINIPCKYIEDAIEIMSDILFNNLLDKNQLKTEKEVVINELKQRNSNPQHILMNMVNQSVFKGNSLGKPVGGDIKSIRNISYKDLVNYMNNYYVPNNIYIVIASSKKFATLKKYIFKYFNNINVSKKKVNVTGSELSNLYYNKQKSKRVIYKSLDFPHSFISFAFPYINMKNKLFVAGELLGTILAGNMMSRLFTELREKKGLVYNVKFNMDIYHDSSIFCISLSTFNNIKKISEVIEIVLDQMKLIKNTPVSSNELKICKDFMIGTWKMTLNDTNEITDFFGVRYLLTNKIISIDQYINLIKNVSATDITKIANIIFNENMLNLAVISK